MNSVRSTIEPDRRQWHLDKTVSISHLITTVSLVVTAIWWAATLDKRMAILEAAQAYQVQRNDQIEHAMREMASQNRDDIKAINAKLDRIMERVVK